MSCYATPLNGLVHGSSWSAKDITVDRLSYATLNSRGPNAV